MYVVRRSFRNNGEVLTPGSVVEPGVVKHFKSRLRDRVIIDVPEAKFDVWDKYFVDKFGVHIDVPKTTEAKPAEAKPAKATKAKVVVKQ